MNIRTITKHVSILLLFASAAFMVAALIAGNATEAFRIGITGWLVGATGYLAGRTDVGAAMFDRAEQEGYDAGFAAGCKARVGAGLADRPLTLLRTPQQLLEQHDLASGTDRVG